MDPIQVLSQPIQFKGGLRAPNRTLKSAMTERLCTYDQEDLNARGKPTAEYVELYKVWGQGKIGIIILGNIPVHREYLEAKGNAIIDKDSPWDPVEAFKPVIAAAKAHGSLVIGQLTHAGRQTPIHVNSNPVSASETQTPACFGMTFGNARALSLDEIHDVIDRFAYGAEVLYKAGADGAQLHGAHGYLLSQFLSPRVNKRTDRYGGTFENRSRIVFEIIDAVKKRVTDPKFILSIKYNSHDFIEGGFTKEDSQIMAQRLEAEGVELIELSGGTYEFFSFLEKQESTKRREGFFLEFADGIRPHLTGASVLAVTGGFRTLEGMSSATSSDKRTCDMVGLARPLIYEPHFVADLLSGKIEQAKVVGFESTMATVAYHVLQLIAHKQPIPNLEAKNIAQQVVDLVTAQ
ncbi:hypothetical protein PSTG_10151 [Puccinia striiformis f. sp. tritici PST-78]|uniref:NADH:flavin oxidoreductase/NADH oxidase N-terminal domain-containing protein n=1 Tax=Puccinia striiformis f. sp. tritici PST-78 TaxID=1165861 RepID=A0A0L0VBF1_9BASI|nr:hypothetical protein PSTG_10151 [Puccinia striiformis f. sp. tritici PST-78]